MADRSVPVKLDRDYHLRFDRVDIKAIENALGIGYPHFVREGIFGSLTATEAFIWRGLREENQKGELVHVFPLNDQGKEQAGELLVAHLQDGGINTAILDAFVAAGLFTRRQPAGPAPKVPEDAPKNSMT